jgi:hypothetical protein
VSAWDEEENTPAGRSYSDAQAAADLAAYRALKRSVPFRSVLVVSVVALVFARWFPLPALALVVGGGCGVANILLIMRSGERLLGNQGIRGFVLSSFLRIFVFGIVPVAFAAHGPWWSMAWYFAGFFLPLALYVVAVPRAFRRS